MYSWFVHVTNGFDFSVISVGVRSQSAFSKDKITFFGNFSDMTWYITLKFVVVFNNIHIYVPIFNTEWLNQNFLQKFWVNLLVFFCVKKCWKCLDNFVFFFKIPWNIMLDFDVVLNYICIYIIYYVMTQTYFRNFGSIY